MKIILRIAGIILLSASVVLLGHFTYNRYNENKYLNDNNQAVEIFLESFTDEEIEPIESEEKEEPKKKNTPSVQPIGVLNINKINLNVGFYNPSSWKNNVRYGVQILDTSVMPGEKGHLILAAHTGTSPVSYFKNLKKLEIGDTAKILYENETHNYILEKTDVQEKKGELKIDANINYSLILVTCTKAYGTTQTIYYFSEIK